MSPWTFSARDFFWPNLGPWIKQISGSWESEASSSFFWCWAEKQRFCNLYNRMGSHWISAGKYTVILASTYPVGHNSANNLFKLWDGGETLRSLEQQWRHCSSPAGWLCCGPTLRQMNFRSVAQILRSDPVSWGILKRSVFLRIIFL